MKISKDLCITAPLSLTQPGNRLRTQFNFFHSRNNQLYDCSTIKNCWTSLELCVSKKMQYPRNQIVWLLLEVRHIVIPIRHINFPYRIIVYGDLDIRRMLSDISTAGHRATLCPALSDLTTALARVRDVRVRTPRIVECENVAHLHCLRSLIGLPWQQTFSIFDENDYRYRSKRW